MPGAVLLDFRARTQCAPGGRLVPRAMCSNVSVVFITLPSDLFVIVVVVTFPLESNVSVVVVISPILGLSCIIISVIFEISFSVIPE